MPGELWVNFQQLKRLVSIEAVLGHYGLLGRLTRKGDQLVGLCPIHHKGGEGQSNRQQFSANTKKNAFTCFAASCGKKGDQIALVCALEGVDARTAGLLMQGWFGITPERPGGPPSEPTANAAGEDPPAAAEASAPTPPEPLKENEPLGWYYQSLQVDHPYLLGRLSAETIAEFGRVRVLKKGELVEATGQLGFCSKGYHKGRVAIPIADAEGVLLAYAGRWAGGGDSIPEGEGKYKLPAAEQLRKSLALFSLHRAVANAGPKRIVIVCEGYFQVMKLWEQGYRCAVAILGSSISERQAELIGAHFKGALVFLDGGAGAAAAAVAGVLARRVWSKVVDCPGGRQPDTLPADELKRLLS